MPSSTPIAPPATAAAVWQFTSLHVQSTGTPFDKTVTDATKIQQLYQAIQNLPSIPDPVSCSPDMDMNNEYVLTFSGAGTGLPLDVAIESSGCQFVRFNGAHGWTKWAASTPQFWQQFADTLGVPESAVYPVPRQPGWPPALTATP